MNIGFDATLLRSEFLTGIEKYIVNLLRAFSHEPLPFTLTVFIQENCPDHLRQLFGEKLNVCVLPSKNRVILDQILLPHYAHKNKIDLMHFPAFGASPFYRSKHLLTIHDATFWKYPDTLSKGGRFYYKPLFNQSIRRAEKIITVSRNSMEDLGTYFPAARKKLTVIYEALDQDFHEFSQALPSNLDREVKEPYILSVGTLEPRKNLHTFIKAFTALKERHHIPHKLVLTGRKGWLEQLNIPKKVEADIIFTGYISIEELCKIYRSAAIYAFPSIYEGFGFPLLEAMASGVPIVSSDASSLPEIGQDACLYVDPYDVNAWQNAILKLISDDFMKAQLTTNGRHTLQQYSWKTAAHQTIDTYLSLLKK